jgi:hypothetical protein
LDEPDLVEGEGAVEEGFEAARLVLQRGRVFCDGAAEVAGFAQSIAARVVLLRSRSHRFFLSRQKPLRMSLSPRMIRCHQWCLLSEFSLLWVAIGQLSTLSWMLAAV